MANARRILKSKKSSHRGIGSSVASDSHSRVTLRKISTPPVSDGVFCCALSSGTHRGEGRWSAIQGIWLPLITPFRDGELDEPSLRRMTRHYLGQPIDGLILAATTGEGLTLDDDETARLVDIVAAEVARADSGLSRRVGELHPQGRQDARAIPRRGRSTATSIACPYYTRPSQDGLYRHFAALAGATQRPILIYNIPYRTGVNLGNETLLRLAALAEHRRREGLLRRPDPVVRSDRARSRRALP